MEETGEIWENHRPWTGYHYPATCLYLDSNPGRSGGKHLITELSRLVSVHCFPRPFCCCLCLGVQCLVPIILPLTDKMNQWKIRNCCSNMSLIMRKPAFCICENKDADQLCSNREADQRLCFCYIDSTIPLHPKSENSSI